MVGFGLSPETIAMSGCRKLISAMLVLGLTLLAFPASLQAQPYDYRHPRRHRHYRPPPHHHYHHDRRPYQRG